MAGELNDKQCKWLIDAVSQDSSSEVFDIIFCRNVMIYFNKQTTLKVLGNLSGSLKNKGYIILGGAESIAGMHHGLESIKGVPSVYRKK